MDLRKVLVSIIIPFCLFTSNAYCADENGIKAQPQTGFTAIGGEAATVTLGSTDSNSGFKFLVDLSTRGAGIEKVTLSEFSDLNSVNPKPLVLITPATRPDGKTVMTIQNGLIVIADSNLQLPLDRLEWKSLDVKKEGDNEIAAFEATIKDKSNDKPILKLTKTYQISKGDYNIKCGLALENLSTNEHKVSLNMTGPAGIEMEDVRNDTRKTIAAFRDMQGQIQTTAYDIKKIEKMTSIEQGQLTIRNSGFVWAAAVNKYFAAILVPTPQENKNFCNWITGRYAWASNLEEFPQGNLGIELHTTAFSLEPAGNPQNTKNLEFTLFVGPKDKKLFDKVPMYKDLAFMQTIDFMACCCPQMVIYPLGFGILALMKFLYGFWPHNYGIVIIILVLLIRLILHPLTRKSQVSMSKYSKFNALPEVQEIKKKYGKDMMEMNRHLSEVQKKYGVGHSAAIMGMLPMIVQMPIWIALYGAIYASIDLRGASFLPFWITNLSAPDALIRFQPIVFPFFGWVLDSLNLLPILMGVAFYLQNKLMPSQAQSTDPQMAQQQKIMMVMMPLLFPLMLYKAPSGLNLYIMASTFGGVIEQYIIRKHIKEQEEKEEQGLVDVTSKTGGKIKKKKPKPFFKI